MAEGECGQGWRCGQNTLRVAVFVDMLVFICGGNVGLDGVNGNGCCWRCGGGGGGGIVGGVWAFSVGCN